jgi:receptor expression-enhancing protein 5/6
MSENNQNDKPEQPPKKISLKEKWNEQMELIYQKTGIKGIYVVIGLIISVILVYMNIFDAVITNFIGTFYPSMGTISSIYKNDLEEQKDWLTYWTVFSCFVLLDMFSPIIIKFIPFYLVIKIILLIWLFMPGSNGRTLIYAIIVRRILGKYEKKVERVIHGIDGFIKVPQENNENKKISKSKLSKLRASSQSMEEALKAAKEMEDNDKNEENKKEEDKKEEEKKEEEKKEEEKKEEENKKEKEDNQQKGENKDNNE